ncbi:UNVERIFIED_CONTAM: hypothetical protein PYX00_004012 [Menopon gallinae]|uniref:E3 UFM1-protein ligase 1 homolog n=1 Tax=Menopon gallinae TaxID=328185 RepID=A0AAW2I3M4_9NEOP
MSASDWEEVKRLAADFQRAQLTSSIQRLSERNCIEIINKLIERNQIEVVFTTDGKEYITPDHLIKEIKDELYVHNGRINLVELAKILSVDLNVISAKAAQIEESTPTITIVNGQLIEQSYINSLCEEINDKLQQHGQIKIADLTSLYDLPSDFLRSTIERQLGKTINAKQDKQDQHMFFTESFIERNKCTVRGALLALTKPVSVSALLNLCNIQDRIFLSVIEELNDSKSLPGTITGKQGINSMYIPSIYLKSQISWASTFFDQNGYLKFSALNRLGISDHNSFIKRNFGNMNVVMLDSCAVGSIIFDQVDAAIDDVISTGTFIDIMSLLPSTFEEKDAEMILNSVIKKKTSAKNLHIFNSTVVVTDSYLRNLMNSFTSIVETKAKECVSSGEYIKRFVNLDKVTSGRDDDRGDSKADRKEERRKKAAEGKGGGGTQGRETKTKSTKKKYMKNTQSKFDDDDSDNAMDGDKKSGSRSEILTMDDVKEVLNGIEALEEDGSEELIDALAEHLYPAVNKNAMEVAKSCYESSIASSHQDIRKKHNELQQKLNDLILKIRLFEKGLKQFTAKDVQQQLVKYLLKSICTDVANDIFAHVAEENMKIDGKEMTTELRVKILNSVPNDIKDTLQQLHKSLTSSTLDDFLNIIDAAVGPGICDIILKKLDKKRERPELLNHRQQLIELLNTSTDPALVLHLTSLIVFQGVTQTILHASSTFVPTILKFIEPHIPNNTFNTLQVYQGKR